MAEQLEEVAGPGLSLPINSSCSLYKCLSRVLYGCQGTKCITAVPCLEMSRVLPYFPLSAHQIHMQKCLWLVLGTRKRWLRAILVLDFFYLFLVLNVVSARLNQTRCTVSACQNAVLWPSFSDLTGQHVLKLKATLITIFQRSLCGL